MKQQPLFDKRAEHARWTEHGLARHTDPKTAKAAAKSVDATKLEAMVLEILREKGSMTSHEIASELGMSMALQSVTPRTAPLKNKGLIRDSGVRRPNESGRKAIVWEAV